MFSFLNQNELIVDLQCKESLKQLYELYIVHKFDLLGSGFIKTNYEINVKGFHGYKYHNKLAKVFGRLAKEKIKNKCSYLYEPINWFADYKSGFFFNPLRYSSQKKCNNIIGKKQGVDIKCPWELGRFYHLVQMAVLASAEKVYRDRVIIEFKNEITDFIKMNPIGKTVQWSAPMDISIRIVNLLIAYDLLSQIDDNNYMGQKFRREFEKHIYNSLEYVMGHLEYIKGVSSNHYLSNLAGIIFAAAYLTSDEWTDACLVFGVQELIDQVEKQFYEEGGHFEGSTSYHRLSAEFVLYPTAIVYGVLNTDRRKVFRDFKQMDIKRLKRLICQNYDLNSKEFFPQWYLDRIYNMGVFTKTILKQNNQIPQIGDNDSGRLIKLTPLWMEPISKIKKENVIDHRTLLSGINALYINNDFSEFADEFPLESSIIKGLSKEKSIYGNMYNTQILIEYGNKDNINYKYKYKKKTILYNDSEKESLLDTINIYYYKKFGIVILRGSRLFLSMVIDTSQNAKFIGHTHNDKLSIEVMVDEQYITRDPGGYIYTAAPEIRDKFRSVMAHNTIHVIGYEQNIFDGVFSAKKRTRAELLYCTQDSIIAKVSYSNVVHIREVKIKEHQIVVEDYSNYPFTVSFKNKIYSIGYGMLEKNEENFVC